jgi:CHAT domain-containing protein
MTTDQSQSNAEPTQDMQERAKRIYEDLQEGQFLRERSVDIIATALAQSNAEPVASAGLTEAVRVPLHELQADMKYLFSRVAADGSVADVMADSVLAKLAKIEESIASAGLIEAAEWLSTAASRFEKAADALRSEYKTYARQMDRWAGDTRERARLFRILSRAADRGVHGELIPDCPTEGVAARQGNGG